MGQNQVSFIERCPLLQTTVTHMREEVKDGIRH